MQRYRPFSRATWCIYLLLLALRVFFAISPSYIHPDEFFQSAEITAGDIFDIDVNIPWEYKPELPSRSILVPAITTGIPFLFLKTWLGNDPGHYVTTRSLFLAQRLAFVLNSLIIDWAVVRMARQIRRSPSIALLLVSSSYVTLTYHTHPFSNTSETTILALCATLLARIIHDHESSSSVLGTSKAPSASTPPVSETPVRTRITSSLSTDYKPTRTHLSFGLGVLFSIGIFTRITFVLYGFPLGIMFLFLNFKASFKQDQTIQILEMAPQDWFRLSFKGSLTLTMLNNLRYNLDEKNLAQHGLHPRFFHLFLNFPILFGNLAFIGVATLIQKARKRIWRSDSLLVTGRFHVDDGMSYTTHVVFYKTYMPPHHLFGFNSEIAQARGVALKISDWREKSRAQLLADLDVGVESQGNSRVDRTLLKTAREQEFRGRQAVLYRKTGLAQFKRTILIAPSTVNFTNEYFYETRDRISRHANFDHIQVMAQEPLRSFDLNVFYL
ncbi:alpha 1,2 mannosyltransferase [Haplosporangium sp. Z 767]|nr:alpha 1,2 mannosyltransferase [Haplosporangium sp. Z 767]